jgi:hypothetical protein
MSEMAEFVLCLGYTCPCGQKVTVFRLSMPSPHTARISPRAVSCCNGHPRSVTLDQLATLDHWVEQVEDEELKTGT